MSQLSWTLLDDFGQKFEIGLYHGNSSRHVLIHVNRKPIVIDFNIRENKKYSFYVGYEMCELEIIKNLDNYSYSFITNRDIDTPLNKVRKEVSRKYFYFIIIMSVVIMTSILILRFLLSSNS